MMLVHMHKIRPLVFIILVVFVPIVFESVIEVFNDDVTSVICFAILTIFLIPIIAFVIIRNCLS